MMDIDSLQRIWGSLDTAYQQWEPYYRELSRAFDPSRQRFEKDHANQKFNYNRQMIDPYPTMAARTLSYGMMAGVTNPTMPWIKLNVADKDLNEFHSVRVWLDEVAKAMLAQFQRSNFYNVMPSLYSDLGIYSMGNVVMQADMGTVLRFSHCPVGSYRIANGATGTTETWAREHRMSAQQMIEKFGRDNVSSQVQSAYDSKNYKQAFTVRHLVAPRMNLNPKMADAKNMAFMSAWWEDGANDGKLLRESGFDSKPFINPRWEAVGNDAFGSFGPGMIALGTARGLQKDHKTRFEAQDKMVNPPLNVPMSMRNNRASLVPGGVNYVPDMNMGAKIESVYNVNYPINDVLNVIQDSRQLIDQAFFANLFLMLTGIERSGVTATEIAKREEEKLLMLGPVLNRLNEEALDPVVERMFTEMNRRQLLPEAPEELEGLDIEIEYVSIMAQAQKMVSVGSIERGVSFIGNLAGAKPEALDKLNVDSVVDEYWDVIGASPASLNSDEQVEQIRQARMQQMQAEQAAAAAQPIQQSAQAAKLLSETDTGTGSALDNIRAAMGG